MAKTKYTRDQKINYYIELIETQKAKLVLLKNNIKRNEERLAFIQSEDYQDWDSDLNKDLKTKKPR